MWVFFWGSKWWFVIIFIFLFIYFWLCLGLCFCARASSSCGEWGPLFIAVRGPLTVAASLVAEHKFQTRRLSSCGSRAQLLRGMWDLPRPGLEPVSPALAGRLSTTAPPGKPQEWVVLISNKWKSTWYNHHNIFSVLETPSWSDEFNIWIWWKLSWCKFEILPLSLSLFDLFVSH